jgi:PRTRC genetic system protein E
MFVELLPILAKRSLVITMTALPTADFVRLTIQPKPVDKADKDDKVPNSYTAEGPAAEVDAKFVAEIAGYTETVLAFYSSLEEVKASTEATLKEVKDEAAKKIAEAKKTGKVGVGHVIAKPAVPAKPVPVKAPEPPSLFDLVPVQAAVAPPVAAVAAVLAPAAPVVAAASDEDDDDPTDDSSDSDGEDDGTSEALAGEVIANNVLGMTPAVTQASQSSMFATSTPTSQIDEAEEMEEIPDGEDQLVAA